jgi:hypothetical protein
VLSAGHASAERAGGQHGVPAADIGNSGADNRRRTRGIDNRYGCTRACGTHACGTRACGTGHNSTFDHASSHHPAGDHGSDASVSRG